MIYGYDVKIGNRWYKAGEEVVSSPETKKVDVQEPIVKESTEKKKAGRPKKVED